MTPTPYFLEKIANDPDWDKDLFQADERTYLDGFFIMDFETHELRFYNKEGEHLFTNYDRLIDGGSERITITGVAVQIDVEDA